MKTRYEIHNKDGFFRSVPDEAVVVRIERKAQLRDDDARASFLFLDDDEHLVAIEEPDYIQVARTDLNEELVEVKKPETIPVDKERLGFIYDRLHDARDDLGLVRIEATRNDIRAAMQMLQELLKEAQ